MNKPALTVSIKEASAIECKPGHKRHALFASPGLSTQQHSPAALQTIGSSWHCLLSIASTAMVLTAILWSSFALSHGTDDDTLRLSQVDSTVRLMTSVSSARLKKFDTNNDGLLSRTEFDHQTNAIGVWLDTGIRVIGANRQNAQITFADTPVPGYQELGPNDSIASIRVVRTYRLDPGDATPMLRFDLFDKPISLTHSHAERHYQLSTSTGTTIGVLTPSHNTIELKNYISSPSSQEISQ